jgi:hypothetical protein
MKRREKSGRTSARRARENPSEARKRTLAHLEKVLKSAAAASAGLVLACSQNQGQNPPLQVCDPPPPPVGCCENPEQFVLRVCLEHQAGWRQEGKEWTLDLRIWSSVYSFAKVTRENVGVTGVRLHAVKVEEEGKQLRLTLLPAKGKKEAEVTLSVRCGEKTIPLKLTLDLSAPPKLNGSVPVKPFSR